MSGNSNFTARVASSVKIVITGAVSIVIQFGLAIVGWGGWNAFWGHPAFEALAWVTVALALLAVPSASSGLSTGEKEDRSNRWVLGAFAIIALLMAYFSAYTDRIGFWVLGRRFSGLAAIQEGHKLETHGIYGVIRHPSYLGLLVSSLGWVLTFRSGVGVILTAALLVPLVARIHAEERLLRAHFGAEYDAYCARTWRLVPWFY
jgi:protein-S-isoprenylcysteine O-methyltransferase Ste14